MNKVKVKDWFAFFAPRFLLLTLVLGLLVRIALILHPVTVVDWGWKDWLAIFGLGLLNDIAFTAIDTPSPPSVIGSGTSSAHKPFAISTTAANIMANLPNFIFVIAPAPC